MQFAYFQQTFVFLSFLMPLDQILNSISDEVAG
jgi:hypothetical protein